MLVLLVCLVDNLFFKKKKKSTKLKPEKSKTLISNAVRPLQD